MTRPIATPPIVLGVDGGGTKTRALVGDAEGRVLGTGEGGSCNAKSIGFEAATRALRGAMATALARAGVAAPVEAACLGLAGVDDEADRARMHAWLAAENVASRGAVVHDSEIVLAAAAPPDAAAPWGIALICGTGSVCLGVSRAGERHRVGGWGFLLGDEGSGYDIAVRALRLATASADGRYRRTDLLRAALAQWGQTTLEGLMGAIYARPPTRTELASFATPVVALADSGDEGARDVLERAAVDAGLMLDTMVRRLADATAPVAFAGGLLQKSPLYRSMIAKRVTSPMSEPLVVIEPAKGALALAQRAARPG